MITKGQRVVFKPEWQDDGDSEITFIAMQDEDGGRCPVMAMLGLNFNPVQVVTVEMIECVVL